MNKNKPVAAFMNHVILFSEQTKPEIEVKIPRTLRYSARTDVNPREAFQTHIPFETLRRTSGRKKEGMGREEVQREKESRRGREIMRRSASFSSTLVSRSAGCHCLYARSSSSSELLFYLLSVVVVIPASLGQTWISGPTDFGF